ncbi:ABC transporter permease subunit [Pseudomonas sp. C2L12B]|uniref:ABC transporter permease subunit n=2 Tax=Pseudomonas typographi TaxID=2715964 RepID=A0ABR7Z564_9PSED|nr:ABC transporter permease subunit [Pseudomonas typographi]MBD1588427.1 ABC transporter permease subunit [Pseudomonas typographi]MBD1600498.1 ABC transporter permease subunit [Pseudomonas typographi]
MALLAMLFVLAPLLISLAISLSPGPFATFPPTGITLAWYAKILHSRDFLASLGLSFGLAMVSTFIALLVGVPASLAIVRGRGLPGMALVEALLLSPLLLPVLITGLSLLQFTAWTGISNTLVNMSIGYVVVIIPYIIRTVVTSLKLVNYSLEEAARTLGASALVAFMKVTLIQIAPGIMAGALFAFMISLDNLTISIWFTNAEINPLPIYMMKRMDSVFDPSIAAMSGVMLLVGTCVVLLLERLVGLRRSMGI